MPDQSSLPMLIVATDADTFDAAPWRAEFYNVVHLKKANLRDIEDFTDDIESHIKFAVLAFGKAASHALHFAVKPSRSLAAVIAYYPPSAPPSKDYHPSVKVCIHLPSSAPFSTRENSKTSVRVYADVAPGFAEPENPAYDRISTSLAFSRSLGLLRQAIGPSVDLEDIWGEHLLYEFGEKDVAKTMATMVSEPYVNHIPTCTGGIGYRDLYRFYRDFFIPGNPPSLKLKLVSRTVGSDRIVDEMIAKFRHTCEIPWMLPGVKPTEKEVEVAVVSVVCIRGGKLYHEHIYWDQATVLVQLGLLDAEKLPVLGKQTARKVENEMSVLSNQLLRDW